MSRPHTDEGNFGTVTHVYWPSDALKELSFEKSVLHQRTLKLARLLMGDDMVFDYDSVIYKPAGSATETPFHQGEGFCLLVCLGCVSIIHFRPSLLDGSS